MGAFSPTGAYAGSQATAAYCNKNGVYRALVLAQNFHAHSALARNYIRVVKGVHKGQAFGLCQLCGMPGSVAEIAADVNRRTHDIGARRLHTVLDDLQRALHPA